jgi:hypothetical protein
LERRMRFSHHPGCPDALTDLRYLRMTYVGFDGNGHTPESWRSTRTTPGRWPRCSGGCTTLAGRSAGCAWSTTIGGTTTGRWRPTTPPASTVAGSPGSRAWSAHAYDTAIDINPVQNPDVIGASVAPRAGRRYAATDRSADAHPSPGVITANGPVVRAFARIGWEWGGTWSSGKDYQHFSAPAQ